MVHRNQESMLVIGQPEQRGSEERRFFQVEGACRIPFRNLVEFIVAFFLRQAREIDDR